ncbi:MAG: FAD-dependent oxidoreductase [Gammaproteobacteria bacterium]|nr:FAD-dependent oxidoreductase [Gammaproteobacteria bacterium]
MGKYADVGRAKQTARKARRTYPFVPPPELTSGTVPHVPVIIAGGGPIGLATAVDLARRGIRSLALERTNTVSDGSRAICWAKRTLEILDRLGTGERMLEKGVIWNVGKVYFGPNPEPLYTFDLLADKEQKFPAFINLQQYYAEEYLIDRFSELPAASIRWQNEVVGVDNGADRVVVTVRTPAGDYQLSCEYLIAADGHRSPVRNLLGLDFEGRLFEDHFLIADVIMKADFPAERRFWFDPPFNPGQTSLIHKQADDVWRIDFQMGWHIDREAALREENVDAKVRAFLGPDIDYEYEWVSLYTFQCRRMRNFVHGRVIFAGDAAHLVSPFGARGANGGIQDVDNLAWKLALVLEGRASAALLQSYDVERIHGADENILNSSRSTDFMTPKSEVSRAFRDAALELARDFPFARRFVNPGRLSVPCTLDNSPLNTPDSDTFSPCQRPGSPCMDAPVTINNRADWLLRQLGDRFTGIYFAAGAEPAPVALGLPADPVPVQLIVVRQPGAEGRENEIVDPRGLLAKHYDAGPGTFYLIRPDQHVAARWRTFDAVTVREALARCLCL